MPLDKNASCLAHFAPYRFDIGIAGGMVLVQHVQTIAAQLDQPFRVIGQADN